MSCSTVEDVARDNEKNVSSATWSEDKLLLWKEIGIQPVQKGDVLNGLTVESAEIYRGSSGDSPNGEVLLSGDVLWKGSLEWGTKGWLIFKKGMTNTFLKDTEGNPIEMPFSVYDTSLLPPRMGVPVQIRVKSLRILLEHKRANLSETPNDIMFAGDFYEAIRENDPEWKAFLAERDHVPAFRRVFAGETVRGFFIVDDRLRYAKPIRLKGKFRVPEQENLILCPDKASVSVLPPGFPADPCLKLTQQNEKYHFIQGSTGLLDVTVTNIINSTGSFDPSEAELLFVHDMNLDTPASEN